MAKGRAFFSWLPAPTMRRARESASAVVVFFMPEYTAPRNSRFHLAEQNKPFVLLGSMLTVRRPRPSIQGDDGSPTAERRGTGPPGADRAPGLLRHPLRTPPRAPLQLPPPAGGR